MAPSSARLARRVRASGDRSFAQYLARLERRDAQEWEPFINALTTNLTSFFREAHHFEILSRHLKSIAEKRAIRIWCSAASTGEEPYSIAMTAVEAFNSLAPPVSIIASATTRRGLSSVSDTTSPTRIPFKLTPPPL